MNTETDVCSYDLSPAALVKRHSNSLLRIAVIRGGSRNCADDIVQSAFLQLVRTQPIFENDRHAKAWLLRVVINLCNDRHRSAWYSKTSSLDALQESAVGANEFLTADTAVASAASNSGAAIEYQPEKAFAQAQIQQTVMGAISSLSPQQRDCVHLFYFEELSIAEIANITEEPESTVKSHLHRGRAQLKTILGEEYDYEA